MLARDIPDTMKAAAVDRFGPPSALTRHDVPVPRPGPHEVLIAIDTAGIGVWDSAIREGLWRKPGRPRFPLVPGVDGAGIVVARGARVRRLQLGDRVYAYEFGNRQGGFYAEYVAAHAEHVGRVPEGLNARADAAAAVTGLTALQSIDWLGLRPGHRRARAAAGAHGADLRCIRCRRHSSRSIRRSTRRSRHRDGIRRSPGTAGPKARRSPCDRRAAFRIHRPTQEVRARRTGSCPGARGGAMSSSGVSTSCGPRDASRTRTASNRFPWSGAHSASIVSTRLRIRVNSRS